MATTDMYQERQISGSTGSETHSHLSLRISGLADSQFDHWLSRPVGVVLSRRMPVDVAAFQEITPMIVDVAEHAQIDYDGWETMVVSRATAKLGKRNVD